MKQTLRNQFLFDWGSTAYQKKLANLMVRGKSCISCECFDMALPFAFQAQTIIAEGRTSQSDVNTIRGWLRTTSLPLLQDEFIVIFLISSENKIDKAKQIIEAYFKVKNGYPNVFNNIDLESEPIKNIQKVA